MVETRSDTEISAEADQQNIQAMAKFDGKIEKLQKELDKQTGKTAIGTGIAAGIGSLPFVGYGIWLKASTGAMACTGASTVLGPALLVGGAMIAAGTNQIMHSTEMIDTFGQEMENMKINFAKVNEVLDQKDSKQADLGNEITTAFHKCVSCNEDFAKSLREHLQEFDNTRKQYNNQVAEYVKGQDKCKVMNLD